jgi:hypothetical protein
VLFSFFLEEAHRLVISVKREARSNQVAARDYRCRN